MAHVFISYKREDGDFASLLKQRLEDAGFDVWMDTDIPAGDSWREAIDAALREAFVCIVVLTPESSASKYVTYEWAMAWGLGVKVIPVLLRPTPDVHPRFEDWQRLDFTNIDARPWDRLIEQVKKLASTKNQYGIPIPQHASPTLRNAISDLDSTDPQKIITAIHTLTKLDRDPAAFEVLISALDHENRDVRVFAAFSVAGLTNGEDERTARGLAESLFGYDSNLQLSAIATLSKIASEDIVPLLIEALESELCAWYDMVAELLGKLGDERAVDVLIKGLGHENHRFRASAASALQAIGSDKALEALRKFWGDQGMSPMHPTRQ